MARTDDKSAALMPKALVTIAGLSLLSLAVDLCIERHHGHDTPGVAWTEIHSSTAQTPEARPTPPVVIPDFSPDSERTLAAIMDKCDRDRNLVLYEFYADWSDPCKKMEATSFSNSQIESLVSKHFVAVRITDKFKEKGKNPALVTELQKKYRVFAFPTLVAVDKHGKTVGTLVGNCSSLTTYRFLSRSMAQQKLYETEQARREAATHGTADMLPGLAGTGRPG